MILLLNGAFGIGKTTVARVLVARMPNALLFDPEMIGLILQRGLRLFGRTVVRRITLPEGLTSKDPEQALQ